MLIEQYPIHEMLLLVDNIGLMQYNNYAMDLSLFNRIRSLAQRSN